MSINSEAKHMCVNQACAIAKYKSFIQVLLIFYIKWGSSTFAKLGIEFVETKMVEKH